MTSQQQKKIAIVTLYDNVNTGNKLQNYAVQEICRELGYQVQSLVNQAQLWDLSWKGRIVVTLGLPRELAKERRLMIARRKRFEEFSRKHLNVSEAFMPDAKSLEEINRQYDAFVVGSDQVWHNWGNFSGELEYFYLRFADENKRVCFAPSFGFEAFPEADRNVHEEGLRGFRYLCCREASGCSLIEQTIGRKAQRLCDPTMMLSRESWQKMAAKPVYAVPQKYMLVYCLARMTTESRNKMEQIAREKGLEILDVLGVGDKQRYCTAPDEFVYLVEHADYVYTDSFHACVFSIIFHRDFTVADRGASDGSRMHGRIDTLLGLFGLEDRAAYYAGETGAIDYAEVDCIMEKERDAGVSFLKQALQDATCNQEQKECYDRLVLHHKADCCGCHACAAACPKGCIHMEADEEGFLYPVIDEEACVRCGRCMKVCPILGAQRREKANVPAVYAAVNSDDAVRAESSSGGIFSLLAQVVLDEGGVVFGAAMSEDCKTVEHVMIERGAELWKLRGSKYVQSTIGHTYEQAAQMLKSGRKVLFSGTPCQIEGLKTYIGSENDKLLCVDLACHGVPSPKAWARYAVQREENAGKQKLMRVAFRDKMVGWHEFSMRLEFADGTFYRQPKGKDTFMHAFSYDADLRPSCHACRFKSVDRISDITLADFWGVEKCLPHMDDNKGVSAVLVHSAAGEAMMQRIAGMMKMQSVNADAVVKYNSAIIQPVKANKNRTKFFAELDTVPFDTLANRYASPPVTFKSLVAKILRKIGLLDALKKALGKK